MTTATPNIDESHQQYYVKEAKQKKYIGLHLYSVQMQAKLNSTVRSQNARYLWEERKSSDWEESKRGFGALSMFNFLTDGFQMFALC